MKSTLNPYNEKPEPFLDTEASARLAKVVTQDSEKVQPARETDNKTHTRMSRLLQAFYYWVQARS